MKDMLERYGIYYEEPGGKLTVADSDVPSAEATRYYLKESVYMDQRTGTFTTKVTALCPVLRRGADEFSTDQGCFPLDIHAHERCPLLRHDKLLPQRDVLARAP